MKLLLDNFRNFFVIFLVILPILGIFSCKSPVTPPAPPAELPSILIFPESIAINIDTLKAETNLDITTQGLALVAEGGAFSHEINHGFQASSAEVAAVDDILAELKNLTIPIDSSVTTYIITQAEPKRDGDPNDITNYFKFNFADFDYNNDGETEGCSGHTGATPICFRLWSVTRSGTLVPENSDYVRLMAGVFETFPSETNPGKGRFKIAMTNQSVSSEHLNIGGTDFFIGVLYDHKNPENKSSEIFATGDTSALTTSETREVEDSEPGEGNFGADGFGGDTILDGHLLITQVGSEANGIKTIQESTHYSSDLSTFYNGRYQEGTDLWIGTGNFNPGDANFSASFTDICAQISNGVEVDSTSNCGVINLNLNDINFLPAAIPNDYDLPDEFPFTPDF